MRLPGWLFIIGVLSMIALTMVCSVVSFTAAQRFVVDMGRSGVMVGNPIEAVRVVTNRDRNQISSSSCDDFCRFLTAQPTSTPTITPLPPTPTATLAPGVTPSPTVEVPTATLDPMAGIPTITDPRQFTVLLLGIDQRTGVPDDERYFRTDTIMVINVDPVRKTVGVLNIPRDLWVTIPNFGEQRINTANSTGDSQEYPGGGPALAAATIQQNLGIEIDKYLLVNFDVFLRMVNLIAPNGVEIEITETIDDPYYPDAGYGFMHVHFDPGVQTLDAERLLQYARTRKTQGGDFDRARRQQQVMRALLDEVLSAGGIGNFIGQGQNLWNELSGSFKTNMTFDEILSLAALAQEIDRDKIHFGTINNMHVSFATTSTNDQVLIPNHAAIRQVIQETFYPSTTRSATVTQGDLKTEADAEGATIVVYNNSGTPGIARQTQEWLISRGVRIQDVGNTPNADNAPTTIRVYTGKMATARYLASLLGLSEDRIVQSTDGLTSADIMIAVGTDIQPLLAAQ